jgi:hypothetical protein
LRGSSHFRPAHSFSKYLQLRELSNEFEHRVAQNSQAAKPIAHCNTPHVFAEAMTGRSGL